MERLKNLPKFITLIVVRVKSSINNLVSESYEHWTIQLPVIHIENVSVLLNFNLKI